MSVVTANKASGSEPVEENREIIEGCTDAENNSVVDCIVQPQKENIKKPAESLLELVGTCLAETFISSNGRQESRLSAGNGTSDHLVPIEAR